VDDVLGSLCAQGSGGGYNSSSTTVYTPAEVTNGGSALSSLKACQHPEGGFGGSHGHMAHLAPTYAALNTLALYGGDEAFEIVDRKKMYSWLLSIKQPDGGFVMHHGGEEDARYLLY
jgi:prenyltransferase beta subunit